MLLLLLVVMVTIVTAVLLVLLLLVSDVAVVVVVLLVLLLPVVLAVTLHLMSLLLLLIVRKCQLIWNPVAPSPTWQTQRQERVCSFCCLLAVLWGSLGDPTPPSRLSWVIPYPTPYLFVDP